MKNSEGLKKNRDFREVYNERKAIKRGCLILYVKENGLGKNRIGISVSKKIGNSVVRHRVKRLIKEAYRKHEELFHTGYDFVFTAITGAKDSTYLEIERAICYLAQRVSEK